LADIRLTVTSEFGAVFLYPSGRRVWNVQADGRNA